MSVATTSIAPAAATARAGAKERPILFSGPMVRALLDGSKTQTRRVVKPGKDKNMGVPLAACEIAGEVNGGDYTNCTHGQPGDRLWVRETWQAVSGDDRARHITTHPRPDRGWLEYAATPRADEPAYKWRPSIHMPRWASRITLEITAVRVERLQSITRGDAMAEGCPFPNMADCPDPRTWYAGLWDQINGPGSWGTNPWVWVIEFKRVLPC